MSSTMPSAIAWRARSALVQWVMCNPSAMGSRQANATIRARCRGGGNPLGAAAAGEVAEQAAQATLLVAATEPPDGGGVALVECGRIQGPLAAGDGQCDASALDGGEGKGAALGEPAQG